jgi:Tfp pilus assembly protein PilX
MWRRNKLGFILLPFLVLLLIFTLLSVASSYSAINLMRRSYQVWQHDRVLLQKGGI